MTNAHNVSLHVDRFGNPIKVGDVIAYYGTNIGLIIGVVVKLNPKSYRVKTIIGTNTPFYYKVLYEYRNNILTADGMAKVKATDVLDQLEQMQLGLI